MTVILHHVQSALAPQAASVAAWLAGGGAVAGAALCVQGPRFSRPLITLIMVSWGALMGLLVPRCLGLGVVAWVTAVVGALVLGVSGLALHRVSVGLLLASMLAVWVGGAFTMYAAGSTMEALSRSEPAGLEVWAGQVWAALSPRLRAVGVGACATAVGGGLAGSILLPRVATCLLFSFLGVSMVVGFGGLALGLCSPGWLSLIPCGTTVNLGALAAMVALGFVASWRLGPEDARQKPG